MNKKNTTRELLIEKIKKQRKELKWYKIRICINKLKVKFYLKFLKFHHLNYQIHLLISF